MTNQTKIQDEYVEKSLKFLKIEKRGLAHLYMRFGKTRYAFEVLKKLVPLNSEILICYSDNILRETWKTESIKWNYNNSNITYCNFTSLHKYQKDKFDVVVGDEVHNLSEYELQVLQEIITNSERTHFLGLSGTISKETREKIGVPIMVEFLAKEAIEAGIVADYNITVHLVNLDNKIKTANKAGKLLTEKQKYDNYSFVIKKLFKEGKNTMHLALSRNRLSIGSKGKIAYLNKLLEKLKDKRYLIFTGLSSVADEIGIPSYHSKSPNDNNLQRFQRGEINHLAMVEKGKTGFTYKDLDGVILLNFTYSSENMAQGNSRSGYLDYIGKCSESHIICISEEPEVHKLKESLSMLDSKKIKYLNP